MRISLVTAMKNAAAFAAGAAWVQKQVVGPVSKNPSSRAVHQAYDQEPPLGSSMRLTFTAWMLSRSGFWVLEVLGNNCLTCIFQIIVMYLQVLECERNQHLVQTSW